MRLSNADMVSLVEWRRELHQFPEVSGEEAETAKRVLTMLAAHRPDQVISGIGGHGVVAVFESGKPGPRVLLRAELDGLPIQEESSADYRSQIAGKGHLCGHDGHMTILAAVARVLGRQRPESGAVILMFQPAEENGVGAKAVLADPKFATVEYDYAFAIHNWPRVPSGEVAIVEGPAFCASQGLLIRLEGRTSHASEPEFARAPTLAVAELLPFFDQIAKGDPQSDPLFSLATVTHVRVGEPSFGVTPGMAEIFVTLRALTNARMSEILEQSKAKVAEVAAKHRLGVSYEDHDVFPTTENHPEAVQIVSNSAQSLNFKNTRGPLPLRGSEDFGWFGTRGKAAIMLLGAGDVSALHSPDYDFPEALIEKGAMLMLECVAQVQKEWAR